LPPAVNPSSRKLFTRVGLFASLFAISLSAYGQQDWPMFGHDDGSTRFSPLDQINTQNVQQLQPAWTYRLNRERAASSTAGAVGHGGGRRGSEAVPIVANGLMYMATPYRTVVALNPETGAEAWSYKLDAERASTRGVSYWPGDKNSSPTIFFATSSGLLIALDAATGKPQRGFAANGILNLKTPDVMNGKPDARYDLTSPPAVYKNLLITGAQVQETPELGASGDTRAWNARTGKMVWRFHQVPHPGETGNDTWPPNAWKDRSGANVWGLMTIDRKLGLLFLPIGGASFDFYGGDRKGNNLFGNSLVALHVSTGKLAWYFQTVHHDIQDYDLQSAPVLVDAKQGGRTVPAVAVIGKAGLLYILDRKSGKPVFGVEERPIPQSPVPGEHSSPTQPFPVKPQPLGRMSFSPDDLATLTPELTAACKAILATDGGMTYGGPFTPLGNKLTIIFPGTIGVTNWQGMSYNPKLGYLFVNTMDLGDVGQIEPAAGEDPPYQRTSPWGAYARFWYNEKFYPCQAPPWGQLWAINANTGDVAWKIPFGTVPELEEKGIHGTGAPNYGGSIASAGGLVFIAAANDQIFRAYDAASGKEVWHFKLPTGSYTVPVTYLGKNGKQYVTLVATGASYYDRTAGDSVIAFALP
jgi:glucose dehydrogenase